MKEDERVEAVGFCFLFLFFWELRVFVVTLGL